MAADVRYLAGFLHHTIADTGKGTMKNQRRERWLQVKAEEWADQLGEMASEIEGTITE